MSINGFLPVQARLQARHDRVLEESQWQRLSGLAGYGAFLQQVRETGLGVWLAGMGQEITPAGIESHLFKEGVHHLADVVRWTPEAWRPAVRWLGMWLPILFGTGHAPSQGEGTLLETEWQHLSRISRQERRTVVRLWAGTWHTLWPEAPSGWKRGLLEIENRIIRTGEAMTGTAADATARTVRMALRRDLNLAFRRHLHQPAAAVIHLALVAITLDALRGALIRRLTFHPGEG